MIVRENGAGGAGMQLQLYVMISNLFLSIHTSKQGCSTERIKSGLFCSLMDTKVLK